MTLFQILTRKLATGKIKATRKLLTRSRRETRWHPHSKPLRGKHRRFSRLICVALAAVMTLSICRRAMNFGSADTMESRIAALM